jgi:hypothetical protein
MIHEASGNDDSPSPGDCRQERAREPAVGVQLRRGPRVGGDRGSRAHRERFGASLARGPQVHPIHWSAARNVMVAETGVGCPAPCANQKCAMHRLMPRFRQGNLAAALSWVWRRVPVRDENAVLQGRSVLLHDPVAPAPSSTYPLSDSRRLRKHRIPSRCLKP